MFTQIVPKYGKNYKAGHVYFTRSTSVLSKGIAWFLYRGDTDKLPEERWTHAGIVVNENTGIEANEKTHEISYCNLQEIIQDEKTRIMFREPLYLDAVGAERILKVASSFIGKRYDYRLFIALAIVRSPIGKILPRNAQDWLLRAFDSMDRFICSEFVMEVMRSVGISSAKNSRYCPRLLFKHCFLKSLKYRFPPEAEFVYDKEHTADDNGNLH